MCEAAVENDRETFTREISDMGSKLGGMKELLLKSMRDDQSLKQQASKQAEGLLKEYAGNIAGQVAKAMNVAISVRINENNSLIDATLRARIPEYAKNDNTSLARVKNPLTGTSALIPHMTGEGNEDILARAAAVAVKKHSEIRDAVKGPDAAA